MNEKLINELDINIARVIKKDIAKKKKFIPLKKEKNNIIILTSEYSENLANEVEFLFSTEAKIELCDYEVLNNFIEFVFMGENENLEEDLIKRAIELNVSDIHIEPRDEFTVIRYRIDGVLIIYSKILISEYNILLSKIKVKCNMDIAEKRAPQDGKYYVKHNGSNYDLRASIIPTFYGEKIVIRLLYGLVSRYTLENLNLTNIQLEKIKHIIMKRNGLVIINGPTGSGKSTTLYAILQEINNDKINITTLEDPIEVIVPGINQMSLNKKAKVTFATGLKAILRQDPDVIMIGEIRDEETANMAIRAALTGHKVYSTIHTKTPKDVYLRLEDMGVKSYLIKDSLVGIISQRLIRVLCEKCKVFNKEEFIDNNKVLLFEKRGCIYCNNSGYKGRRVVSSVNYLDIEKESQNNYNETYKLDNREMKVNLIELLKSGCITITDYKEFILMEGIDETTN